MGSSESGKHNWSQAHNVKITESGQHDKIQHHCYENHKNNQALWLSELLNFRHFEKVPDKFEQI